MMQTGMKWHLVIQIQGKNLRSDHFHHFVIVLKKVKSIEIFEKFKAK